MTIYLYINPIYYLLEIFERYHKHYAKTISKQTLQQLSLQPKYGHSWHQSLESKDVYLNKLTVKFKAFPTLGINISGIIYRH